MIEQAYAMYTKEDNKLTGVVKYKELADAIMGAGNELSIKVIANPISSEDYDKLRKEHEKKLMGNFPQNILNREENN